MLLKKKDRDFNGGKSGLSHSLLSDLQETLFGCFEGDLMSDVVGDFAKDVRRGYW